MRGELEKNVNVKFNSYLLVNYIDCNLKDNILIIKKDYILISENIRRKKSFFVNECRIIQAVIEINIT